MVDFTLVYCSCRPKLEHLHPCRSFFIRHAKGKEMSNVEVSYLKEDLRPPFVLIDVNGADFSRLKARHAITVPTFTLSDVEDFSVQQSAPLADTRFESMKKGKLQVPRFPAAPVRSQTKRRGPRSETRLSVEAVAINPILLNFISDDSFRGVEQFRCPLTATAGCFQGINNYVALKRLDCRFERETSDRA